MTGFNDGLRIARESLAILLNTLRVVEYDSDSEKVQYGPDDRALFKAHPLTPQGMLAHLTAEFDHVISQVGDDPPNLKATNAHTDPPS